MKIVLLTGASSGIGYDAALALAQRGHRVYAAARRVERMEPLRAAGVVPVRMDVEDEDSMQAAVNLVLQQEGRIDVLINNAGYGYYGPVEAVPLAEARRQLEVNLFGRARLSQLVLPAMRAAGQGRIINTASVAGHMVMLYGGWYHVSKYAVEALSDAMRMELRPLGIDVVMVEPGVIKTAWGLIAADHLEECTRGTAYEASAQHEADNLRWTYTSRLGSNPKVVTRAICRAVSARRPKARYMVGRFAQLLKWLHRLLPTRWWDSMQRMLGRKIM